MQSYAVYFIWKLLCVFRVVPPPIIRNANCIYSIWYLPHRYCYLPLAAGSSKVVLPKKLFSCYYCNEWIMESRCVGFNCQLLYFILGFPLFTLCNYTSSGVATVCSSPHEKKCQMRHSVRNWLFYAMECREENATYVVPGNWVIQLCDTILELLLIRLL